MVIKVNLVIKELYRINIICIKFTNVLYWTKNAKTMLARVVFRVKINSFDGLGFNISIYITTKLHMQALIGETHWKSWDTQRQFLNSNTPALRNATTDVNDIST